MIKQMLRNILLDDLLSLNNGVSPDGKSFPREKTNFIHLLKKARRLHHRAEQQDLHK